MRYNYSYHIFGAGFNILASASFSTYAITVTTVSAVREYARKVYINNPVSSIYVVRTPCNNPLVARFFEYDIATGRLVSVDASVALMAITKGPEYMPR